MLQERYAPVHRPLHKTLDTAEEEMTEHLAAGYRERTESRRGERNGYSTRDLITPAGRIAQLRVPRDREGTFLTEVFERYKRMTGEVAVHLG
jgi:putative transposase